MTHSIRILDGFVDIDTGSPNGQFYYRITKPYEASISLYAAQLAFFDSNDNLVFQDNNCLYLNLPPLENFKNAIWLQNGDFAFFVEYTYKESKICTLNLEDKILYKRNYSGEDLMELINNLEKNVLSDSYFVENGFKRIQLENTRFRSSFKKWYPR